jgi:large subunit ribosomal protein L29
MATAHELDDLNDVDTGQLESHGRLRAVKKDIARIYTVVRERELGIRSAPGTETESKEVGA